MEEEEAAAFLPEEIIVLILLLLPVKSLIRFASVSKRFRFIILSDPNFGKSHLKSAHEHKTLAHRLLLRPQIADLRLLLRPPQRESLDLDTHAFGDPSSVYKVTIPFELPAVDVTLMDSSNGIVFFAFSNKMFYAWNPSTGFFKRLPDLGSPLFEDGVSHICVGYFPATNDYRVFIYSMNIDDNPAASVFSTKANASKLVQVSSVALDKDEGVFFKEALHWIDSGDIVAFDLAEEKEQNNFRIMSPPNNDDHDLGGCNYIGVPIGGFLTLAHFTQDAPDYIEVWVMKTYGVSGSWTKIFNLNVSDPLLGVCKGFNHVWVMENSTVAESYNGKSAGLIRIDHKEEGRNKLYEVVKEGMPPILYQETLIQLDD